MLFTANKTEKPPPRQDLDPEKEFEAALYHITHDLMAPVRALAVLPSWIREDLEPGNGPLPGSVAENLEMMEIQAERLSRMLIDLRTLSRVGRCSDPPNMIHLPSAMDEALRSIDMPDGFKISTAFESCMPRAPFNDMVTLLSALVDNAITHRDTLPGQVHLVAATRGNMVHFAVEDDGNGIEPEFRERVFEMMSTLRPRDEVEGSGLGLPICRRIVETAGGEIRASAPRELGGARIEFTLPGSNSQG